MPRILPIAVLAVVAVFAVSPAYAQTQSAVEREIVKLEHDWTTADHHKDRAALENLIADDFIGTDSSGNTVTKSEEIASAMESKVVVQAYSESDLKVQVYGEVAVVTYRYVWKGTNDGKDATNEGRSTDVWVKRGGRWQVVGYHNSRIVKK